MNNRRSPASKPKDFKKAIINTKGHEPQMAHALGCEPL